jgi:diacylglycerol kinase family enzyme
MKVSASRPRTHVPPLRSRIAAGGGLAVGVVALLALVVFTVQGLPYVFVSWLAATLAISALWIAATNRRFRWLAVAGAVIGSVIAIAGLVATGRAAAWFALGIVGLAVAAGLATLALRWEAHQDLAARWHRVAAAQRGVVLINPRSGDGKAARLHLADEARRRGIEPVVLEPGDDLRALAEAAVTSGADVLGMAGGDGSQAIVATVAAAHGLSFVCIPAGTRNHFALDLGVDRDDPVRALDAFGPAQETTIDLAEVNGEAFLNNVSLGLYAHFVASDAYREAKSRTVAEMLPDLLGPGAPPFGLSVDSEGGQVADLQVILVSNNPYTLSSLAGFGSRARLDTGALGVATLSISRTADVDRLVALEAAGHPERYEGWRQWTAPTVEVRGPPASPAAVDGDARTWDPPLRFAIRPGALRVRIGLSEPGVSPALPHSAVARPRIAGLARVMAGRPSGIVITESQATHDHS